MFVHLVEDQVLESEPLAKAMEQMDSTVKQANASVINLLKLDRVNPQFCVNTI